MSKPNYQIKCQAGKAELYIYDVIDSWGISAQQIAKDLKEFGPVKLIDVHINSPGGSYFQGIAIYNLLKLHSARIVIHVDGMALSMGSVVAMAGDKIHIAENAWLMLHDPVRSIYEADAEELRKSADMLDKTKDTIADIYAERSGIGKATIIEMMDEETWLTAAEAVDWGFADTVSGPLAIAAHANLTQFRNTPDSFRERTKETTAMADDKNTPQPATFEELKAACPGATSDFLCSQMEVKAIAADSTVAWSTYQIKAAKQEAADAKAVAEKAKADAKAEVDKAKIDAKAAVDKAEAAAKAPGSDPLRDDGDGKGGKSTEPPADGDFWAVVDAKVQAGLKKPDAIKAVVREEPELHEAMLESNVVTRKRKR